MPGELSATDLEGRLTAHRQILTWLLGRIVVSPDDLKDLKAELDVKLPPPDHQEDPGAIPTIGHAVQTAAGLEARVLIEHLQATLERRQASK
ncbi:hypothetical protein [Pelagibacterium luteolum]|uniref:Uncharacterized protein n=1 Tax=Pelagibacterium luteolum TaxID=440168 RepID=A0A1G8A843_9HYPH|nr:hypothetical protein [Pelagibacterium luteolum]SDH17124.1 hypothetical protein SAMN04487974_12713 [Pelagibacterium luteolum]